MKEQDFLEFMNSLIKFNRTKDSQDYLEYRECLKKYARYF